ncbi:MAG: sigma-54 dependent transcriptional regulator [Candidatus Margulisbacteria bacterium]|nr:sigma-54 dependent transcriptional regulator [Candidatus Margulisiibacteriota bacterium]MBU1729769.1 sigma-54 dependent transcriptional regulator [Candidatus Margulisiibacteriota bacterium]MBU1955270.1 sigma-54 dependent transcriptional regulator [Candidatus Margulisiibacteriota bacterium]
MESPKNTILVVDDELSIRESFRLILEGPYALHLAATGESALKKLVDEKIDMVFLDVRMPGMNGLEALKRIKEIDPNVEVVMVTAVNDVQKAGEAIKTGAVNYLIKPFDVVQITNMVANVLKKKAIVKESKNVRQVAQYLISPPELIGSSDKIQLVKNKIDKIAKSAANVLVKGAIGTEKESVARLIQKKSNQNHSVLVVENLKANVSAQKLNALFFGRGTGSSTVSLEKQIGLLEKATDGILFINNIENLPLSFQGVLADTLTNQQFTRQDSSSPIKFNCHLVCATTKDLKKLAEEDKFNKKLLEIIAEETIDLPRLAGRTTDIPLLINEFVEEFKIIHHKKITGLTNEAIDILSSYDFPGNVDELRSMVELLVLKTTNELIQVKELPLEILVGSPSFYGSKEGKDLTYDEMQTSFEKAFIKKTLEKSSGDIKKASRLLGLAPRVLATKIETLGIS